MKTILIALMLLVNVFLKAQDTNVIFFDYTPDIIIKFSGGAGTVDSLKIDFNEDGTDDILLYQKLYSFIEDRINPLHSNCQYAFFDSIMSDSLTSSNLTWYTGQTNWETWRDRSRLAIRLIDGADYYYGWINFFITDNYPRTITIYKYAFCKIANYPFLFGQTELATSVNELQNDNNTQVYFNGSSANIVIQSDKQLKDIKLVNMLGATVKTINNINSLNTNISAANLAHGNYIVQVRFKDDSVYAVQVAF